MPCKEKTMSKIDGATILITGGTGSLGAALTERLLSGQNGVPKRIIIFSRDELKQAEMRTRHHDPRLDFQIGDVRYLSRIEEVMQGVDIVLNAAAMKRVETCERHPDEAVETNIRGTVNILSTIRRYRLPVHTVVGVSSDKGAHPVNVYGATKFLQERVLLAGNGNCPGTRCVAVCYGNVMGSRGSVIPIFQEQIRRGGPVTVHDPDMTRFLISLDRAVETVMVAVEEAQPGEIYVPVIGAARVGDIASVLINGGDVETVITGIGAGEKMHETLIIEQDAGRVVRRSAYYVVTGDEQVVPVLAGEYVSSDHVLPLAELERRFVREGHIEKVRV
jgi:UDP-glucose 4-epimerase